MGKPRKLRSSINALRETIKTFRPVVGAPLCIEPSETHSFRELCTSFNSIYYTHSSSSVTSFSSDQQQQPPTDIRTLHPAGGEEEAVTSNTATNTSTCSSRHSSSSVAAAAPRDEPTNEAEDLPRRGAISSKRFFFSPCTTKSIMGEEKHEVGLIKMESSGHPRPEPDGVEAAGEEERDEVIDVVVVEEAGTNQTAADSSALCRESIPMAMASNDPYRDFRSSMEEMVEAHGLRSTEWGGLQELLHCYLRLNEKMTHKFIVLAFVDLLKHLDSQDNNKKKKHSNKNA